MILCTISTLSFPYNIYFSSRVHGLPSNGQSHKKADVLYFFHQLSSPLGCSACIPVCIEKLIATRHQTVFVQSDLKNLTSELVEKSCTKIILVMDRVPEISQKMGLR